MKQTFLPLTIICAFCLSLIYWIYLAFYTGMNISCDSIGYSELGRLLQNQGLLSYFKTGPQRELLYPLLISMSMHIETLTGIVYTKIMAGFGVIILSISQILIYLILRRLNIRIGICAIILLYFGISPSLNNTAFSLYSEVATYPFILGMILISHHCWEAMNQNRWKHALISGAGLGMLAAIVTLIKAVFEVIFPLYLLIFITTILFIGKKERPNPLLAGFLCAVAALSCYYAPIIAYKSLNQKYNSNFVITNRGSWALYGNTARRMEPLTFKRFLTALAYVPGEGVCNSLFKAEECRFWSFYESDTFGLGKLSELNSRGLSTPQINDELIHMSKQKVLQNPLQYALLMALEGGKMFFWESTQIGFVQYPTWLQKTYDTKLFKDILRLLISTITLICFFGMLVALIRRTTPPIIGSIILLTSLYIIFYAFFFILTRYALPIAPLYLILIGYTLNTLLPQKKT